MRRSASGWFGFTSTAITPAWGYHIGQQLKPLGYQFADEIAEAREIAARRRSWFRSVPGGTRRDPRGGRGAPQGGGSRSPASPSAGMASERPDDGRATEHARRCRRFISLLAVARD